MGLRIKTNITSINAQRNLVGTQQVIEKSSAQLASGYRINRAADDAAGLAISENMKAQMRSSAQARRNANDGISLAQTGEGGLTEVGNLLIRMRELGIQAASDTVGSQERRLIDMEVQQLKQEIERTAQTTAWNSTPLLNGTTPVFDFHVGAFSTDSDVIQFDGAKNVATLEALGIENMDFTTKENARAGLGIIDKSQDLINGMRADLGALQSRLSSTVDILAITEENLAAANSRIRDTDIAAASSEIARNSVMLQSGMTALAQSNQNAQMALKLLG